MVWEKGGYLTAGTHGGRSWDSTGSSQAEFHDKKNPMCGQHLYFGPRQDRGQDPEGQRRSALTPLPHFVGLGRTGGAALGLGGSQGSAGQFHPRQAAGEVPGTSREEPPARLPHSGLPGASPARPARLPGALQRQQPRQGTLPSPGSSALRRPKGEHQALPEGTALVWRHEPSTAAAAAPLMAEPLGASLLPPPPAMVSSPRLTHSERRGLTLPAFPALLIHIYEGETGGPQCGGAVRPSPAPRR